MRSSTFALALALSALPGCSLVAGLGDFRVEADAGSAAEDAGRDAGADAFVPPADACVPRTFYRDTDEDGFGDPATTSEACEMPDGFVENADDCDDGAMTVAPGADEACDSTDNDCDGAVDEGLLGPVGATVDIARDGCCSGPALVASEHGVTVAWGDVVTGRLSTSFLDHDPSVAPITRTVLDVAGDQTNPFALLFESELGPPKAVVVWQEDRGIRMLVMAADGSDFPLPFAVSETPGTYFQGSYPHNPLAVVGERVVATWTVDLFEGTIGVRVVDPLLGAPVEPEQVIDLDPTAANNVTFLLGWAGIDDPSALVGSRIYERAGMVSDLISFDLTDDVVTWRGEEGTLASDPSRGTLTGWFPEQPRREATEVWTRFAWTTSSESGTCFGRVSVPASGAPSLSGDCTDPTFIDGAYTLRDGLATTVFLRSAMFVDLFQQPLDDSVSGAPATLLAETYGGGPGVISMYGGRGAIAFQDEDPSGDRLLRVQRIGCE